MILEAFDTNPEELKKLMNEDNTLKVNDINVWKDKADDIIGEDLEEFQKFLCETYSKKQDKYAFKFRPLRDALCAWCKYENLKRHGGLNQPALTETETMEAISIVQDDS